MFMKCSVCFDIFNNYVSIYFDHIWFILSYDDDDDIIVNFIEMIKNNFKINFLFKNVLTFLYLASISIKN